MGFGVYTEFTDLVVALILLTEWKSVPGEGRQPRWRFCENPIRRFMWKSSVDTSANVYSVRLTSEQCARASCSLLVTIEMIRTIQFICDGIARSRRIPSARDRMCPKWQKEWRQTWVQSGSNPRQHIWSSVCVNNGIRVRNSTIAAGWHVCVCNVRGVHEHGALLLQTKFSLK